MWIDVAWVLESTAVMVGVGMGTTRFWLVMQTTARASVAACHTCLSLALVFLTWIVMGVTGLESSFAVSTACSHVVAL